jgi:xyloglucan-specific endo-beta-1,4-glucanase
MQVQKSPPAFDATWMWQAPNSYQVHSFPYVKLLTADDPVPLPNISSLVLTTQWAMQPGSTSGAATGFDSNELQSLGVVANVAFDMFADPNPNAAQGETLAGYEIMIWLGSVGSPQPIGYTDASPFHQMLDGVDL